MHRGRRVVGAPLSPIPSERARPERVPKHRPTGGARSTSCGAERRPDPGEPLRHGPRPRVPCAAVRRTVRTFRVAFRRLGTPIRTVSSSLRPARNVDPLRPERPSDGAERRSERFERPSGPSDSPFRTFGAAVRSARRPCRAVRARLRSRRRGRGRARTAMGAPLGRRAAARALGAEPPWRPAAGRSPERRLRTLRESLSLSLARRRGART